MAAIGIKNIKSIYKHVVISLVNGKTYYRFKMSVVGSKTFNTEREAALAVDKYWISKGKNPVNILVKK